MEKIWHKKKKTRILLIIIANVMVISMMLGVMSIMSYAELFDDLITGKLTQSYEAVSYTHLEKGGLEQAEDGFGAVSVKSGRQVRNLALNGIRPLQRKSVDGTR